jgi:hypothetical protein
VNDDFKLNTVAVNQAKLIIKGFGLGALKPKFYHNAGDTNQRTLEEIAREEGKEGIYNGDFGLPVFDTLTFVGTSYTTLDGKTITIPTINMGVALIEVSQSKNIVTTAIQGRNGTIKEYISDGDFVINIKGVLTSNAQDVYPTELVKQLLSFCAAPISFGVASSILEKFGIQEIVIQEFSFPQVEGMRNIAPFQIQCLSETPFEIKNQTQNNNNTAIPSFL